MPCGRAPCGAADVADANATTADEASPPAATRAMWGAGKQLNRSVAMHLAPPVHSFNRCERRPLRPALHALRCLSRRRPRGCSRRPRLIGCWSRGVRLLARSTRAFCDPILAASRSEMYLAPHTLDEMEYALFQLDRESLRETS